MAGHGFGAVYTVFEDNLETYPGESWPSWGERKQQLIDAGEGASDKNAATYREAARTAGEDQGLLTGEESFLLHTLYGSLTEPSWATGFRIPDEAVPILLEIFVEPGRPQPPKSDGDHSGDGSRLSETAGQ
ncbi:hypothetical protein ACFVYD_21850 [Streptomyces sp. NPDC058301]|uniref:hypothetical protein n=1 Tax=Streptomyces sp. NPDC058301 TaxID=3346436 RepID=UPI0036E2EA0E